MYNGLSASPVPPAIYTSFLLASPNSLGYCRWLCLEPAVEVDGPNEVFLLWFFHPKWC